MQPCRRFAHEKIGLIHVNQKGYPECLVDNRSPWGCSTDKGTQFIWEFLNKNHESP